jgi:hypothetical protein
MSLAPIVSAAIVLIVLLAAGVRLWTARSRRSVDAPVTEAEARAHALPLSTSILSIGPRVRDPGGVDT